MAKRHWVLPALIFIALIVIVVAVLRIGVFTGNVLLESDADFVKGGKLSGILTLNIEEGDSLREKTTILVAIMQDETVLEATTLTLGEYIELSNNLVSPIPKEDENYFEQVGSYKVDIADILQFNFPDSGEYELLFSILTMDLNQREKLVVN